MYVHVYLCHYTRANSRGLMGGKWQWGTFYLNAADSQIYTSTFNHQTCVCNSSSFLRGLIGILN